MISKRPDTAATPLETTLSRKVRISAAALFFERLWPRLWIVFGVAAVFAAVSLTGLWPVLPDLLHKLVLLGFGIGFAAALFYAVRAPWPSRDEALRHLEARSGSMHRPASSYEDTLSGPSSGIETDALWQAHRSRLARSIGRLKVGRPSPRADLFDPLALRALAILVLLPAAVLVSGSFFDRMANAFRFGSTSVAADTRVDAWVTPPPYTALPPVMLADGAQPIKTPDQQPKFIGVPERSLLTLRATGYANEDVAFEVQAEGSTTPERVTGLASKDKSPVGEVRFELRKSARIRAVAGTRELGQWTFDVIADALPKITLDRSMERTPKGSMKVMYKAEDDYGVASAFAKVRPARPKAGDAAKSWARPAPLTGPRRPLEKPPVLALKLLRPGAKTTDGTTLLDFAQHPWAGQRVEFWVEATDVAGQTGRSAPVELVLPSRRFNKPLARAVIEQRRKLAEDSRNRPMVTRALDALTIEPEGFIESKAVYIGLRSVFHRLEREKSRDAMARSISDLWQIALKIEDGALSDAERDLKSAQDKLSDAIERGAEDGELSKLMQELRQALNNYLQEMQKNAENDAPRDQPKNQGEQDDKQLGQQDLDRMMDELEKTARDGSREDAEKMLAELRELMDKLQANNTPEARAEQQRAEQMMKKLNELSDLTGKQRKLMDETFSEQRKQGSNPVDSDQSSGDRNGREQRGGKSGQKGQQRGQQDGGPPGGQSPDGGKQSQGEGGQGQGANQKPQQRGLRERQAQLRKELERLQEEMEQLGAGDPEKLGDAQQSMENAEKSLEGSEFDEATEQQAQALDQMRESAQQMTEQLSKQGQQKVGRGGDTPRDPLGRPQRSTGPDMGTSVKVPDAIDAQRAREILDELRRRSGEALRPPGELNYLERLLRRF